MTTDNTPKEATHRVIVSANQASNPDEYKISAAGISILPDEDGNRISPKMGVRTGSHSADMTITPGAQANGTIDFVQWREHLKALQDDQMSVNEIVEDVCIKTVNVDDVVSLLKIFRMGDDFVISLPLGQIVDSQWVGGWVFFTNLYGEDTGSLADYFASYAIACSQFANLAEQGYNESPLLAVREHEGFRQIWMAVEDILCEVLTDHPPTRNMEDFDNIGGWANANSDLIIYQEYPYDAFRAYGGVPADFYGTYMRSDFLEGIVRLIGVQKLFLYNRYGIDRDILEMENLTVDEWYEQEAQRMVTHFNTLKVSELRDDTLVFTETETDYWYFYFDMDVSDCDVLRLSKDTFPGITMDDVIGLVTRCLEEGWYINGDNDSTHINGDKMLLIEVEKEQGADE